MTNYSAEIQNVVRTAVDEYRITFRLYDQDEVDRHRWCDVDASSVVHSMTAKIVEGSFRFAAEGALADCIRTYLGNTSFENVPECDLESWKIAALADSIMSSLADRGFLEAWYTERQG